MMYVWLDRSSHISYPQVFPRVSPHFRFLSLAFWASVLFVSLIPFHFLERYLVGFIRLLIEIPIICVSIDAALLRHDSHPQQLQPYRLVSALGASVLAAPRYPELNLNAVMSGGMEYIADYFNLLAGKVQEARAMPAAPVCDLSKAVQPVGMSVIYPRDILPH